MQNHTMPIIYETDQQELKVSGESNLLDVCIKNKVDIDHSCEGGASCGTCRILVTDGLDNFPPRNFLEQEMADDRHFEPHERLACQTRPKGSFKFILPKDI